MKYLLLIYGNQEKWDSIPAAEWPKVIAEQDAWNDRYRATGELLGAYGLGGEQTAKLIRRKDGVAVVTDGPYLETKEYLASWYLIDVDSEQRALEIAAALPSAVHQPTEVWPILHEASPETGADIGVA